MYSHNITIQEYSDYLADMAEVCGKGSAEYEAGIPVDTGPLS